MNKNDWRYPVAYVIIIVFISLAISCWWIPATYYYNSDVYISPVGMMISESYRTVPFSLSHGIPGFYAEGIYAYYNNWPPLNFLVLSGWQELVGPDILSSRWMYVILKLATDILCFVFLYRVLNKKAIPALLATIVFLFFSYRILYGLLIYCDSWILLFGFILSLMLIRVIRDDQLFKPKTLFQFGCAIGIGTLFSWQVFFYLPAIILYGVIRKRSIPWKWALAGSIPALLLLAGWLYWIKSNPPELQLTSVPGVHDSGIFHQLMERSWIGFFKDPGPQSIILLKRIVKTIIEYLPIILLFFYNRLIRRRKYEEQSNSFSNVLISFHFNFLMIYLLVMPMMYGPHEHQIPLFSILAILILARELSQIERPLLPTLAIIGYQLLAFFFVVPRIHKVDTTLKEMNNKIVNIVQPAEDKPKPILILVSGHPNHMGLAQLTHAHLYTWRSLEKFDFSEAGLNSSFHRQWSAMAESARNVADSSQLWIITATRNLCERNYAGFRKTVSPLNDSVCLLHLVPVE